MYRCEPRLVLISLYLRSTPAASHSVCSTLGHFYNDEKFLVDEKSNVYFQFFWIKSSFDSLLVVFFELRTILNAKYLTNP